MKRFRKKVSFLLIFYKSLVSNETLGSGTVFNAVSANKMFLLRKLLFNFFKHFKVDNFLYNNEKTKFYY